MSVFIDTSAWFAAANRKDRDHAATAALLRSQTDRVITDFVLVETWLLIKNRMDFKTANMFWAGIQTGVARLEEVDSADVSNAWNVGQKFTVQNFSIVDLTSFIVMERLGLTRVITLDSDFAVYRYGPNRGRAFEVLR